MSGALSSPYGCPLPFLRQPYGALPLAPGIWESPSERESSSGCRIPQKILSLDVMVKRANASSAAVYVAVPRGGGNGAQPLDR